MIDSRTIRNLLVTASVAGFVVVLGAFNASKPRILVLHSAGPDSPWAAGVDRGIREILAANRRPVTVRWHRLGLTRRLTPEARETAVASGRQAIDAFDPDVLVAVDDEANAAVARGYNGPGRPRVLYVSIDLPPEAYGYGAATDASGIGERLPLAAVRDAVSAIRGTDRSEQKIAAVAVDNETGRAERMQVEAFDWSPHTLVAVAAAADAAGWRRFIETDAADADVLLVLSTSGLDESDGTPSDGPQLAEWVEANARPLPIGLHAGYVRDGGGLAISPPPVAFGRLAMERALALLDTPSGQTAGLPPPVVSEHFDVAVDPRRLTRRGVVVPPIYIEAARAAGNLVGEDAVVPPVAASGAGGRN